VYLPVEFEQQVREGLVVGFRDLCVCVCVYVCVCVCESL
jgi:hypothetical protein